MHRKEPSIKLGKMPFYGKSGHCVGAHHFREGNSSGKAKVELILKLSFPTNVKTVWQCLGHVGFYRRFIRDFSKISKPLYKLLEKDAKFEWDAECQEKFEELKAYLTTTPIVRAPD